MLSKLIVAIILQYIHISNRYVAYLELIQCYCEAARVNTMTGGLDLSFGFPRNGKIPHPHQVTWSQPINMYLVRNKGRAEKPEKVCTNKIALQTCNQSA